jgi:hypothetical protein
VSGWQVVEDSGPCSLEEEQLELQAALGQEAEMVAGLKGLSLAVREDNPFLVAPLPGEDDLRSCTRSIDDLIKSARENLSFLVWSYYIAHIYVSTLIKHVEDEIHEKLIYRNTTEKNSIFPCTGN